MAEIPKKAKPDIKKDRPRKGASGGAPSRASGVPDSIGGSRQGNIGHEGNTNNHNTHR